MNQLERICFLQRTVDPACGNYQLPCLLLQATYKTFVGFGGSSWDAMRHRHITSRVQGEESVQARTREYLRQ